MRHGWLELKSVSDRFKGSPVSGDPESFLRHKFRKASLDDLWEAIAAQPYPISFRTLAPRSLEEIAPDEANRVRAGAEKAMAYTVDLLGSGDVTLEEPIDWSADFKNAAGWPLSFFRDINVSDQGRESDIKVPWELSRLQWLTPVAQAYLLEGDEKYAAFVKTILESWIEGNPYARGPNWAVTMEPAMRVFTWTWLFHVFSQSEAWKDAGFQTSFLGSLYEHGAFCAKYLENFGTNGNHLTADTGALVFIAEFFPQCEETCRWGETGWRMMISEIFKQVHEDGADFEGSASYHRMVAELFLWPAIYRKMKGKGVPEIYVERLRKMAAFTAAYMAPDGLAPLWGDSDDGRPFIFGGQSPSQHGYLPALIGLALDGAAEMQPPAKSAGEILWSLGEEAWAKAEAASAVPPVSAAFPDAGVYVMTSGTSHVVVDCGPVGYGGRGGHGHNDCLSFEARLKGVPVITDSGTYVYTQDIEARNDFRSTAYHSTPQIDGEEINRFTGPEDLFSLLNDGVPEVRTWRTEATADVLIGSHSGYERLSPGLRPVRAIILDKLSSGLIVRDAFEGTGEHDLTIRYHLSIGAALERRKPGLWQLVVGDEEFVLFASPHTEWTAEIRSGWTSEKYGQRVERPVLCFARSGPLAELRVAILPATDLPDDVEGWVNETFSAHAGD